MKIVMRGQRCQSLVKLVAHNCFHFSPYKNRDMRVAIPKASQARCVYLFLYPACKYYNASETILAASQNDRTHFFFTFLLVKIVTRGQLYQQLVKLVVYNYFRFSAWKNCNKEALPALQTHVLQVSVIPTKILSRACTCALANCKYLIFHL